MTFSPFFQLPVSLPGASGPVLSASNSRPIFPLAPEEGAYGHWDFGGDSDSLRNLIDGRELTLAGSAPTYSANSIKTASGGTHGLVTNLDDPAALTFCAVVKLDLAYWGGGDTTAIAFNTSTTSAGDGGQMGFLTQKSPANDIRVQFQSRPHSLSIEQNIGSSVVAGDPWVFIAWSRDATPSRRIYSPGLISFTDTPSGAYVPASKKLAIGNGYYPSAGWQYGMRFAEVIIFTQGKSLAQMAEIAARSKTRMQSKGIALHGL